MPKLPNKAMRYYTKIIQDRALQQRLYLIKESKDTDTSFCYQVLGSTGNVYEVTLSMHEDFIQPLSDDEETDDEEGTREAVRVVDCRWKCSCPHFQKRWKPCKHIYFIALRALSCKNNDSITEESIWVLANERHCKPCSVSAPDHIVEEYEKRAAEQTEECEYSKCGGRHPKQKEYVGEDCAICFDEMTDKCKVVFCKTACGNSLHKDCFERWYGMNKEGTCVHCRQPYDLEFFGMRKKNTSAYMNISVE
jgi:hypothetical protein